MSLTDWRGVKIEPGATVIEYSRVVGIIESVVDHITDNGLVAVTAIRARNPKWIPVATWFIVPSDATVTGKLPESPHPTIGEARETRTREEMVARRAFSNGTRDNGESA